MKERHWMGAGEAMERMRRRLCFNLGKNAELGKEEDKTKPLSFFYIFYAISYSYTNKIFTLQQNDFSFVLHM